mmetsp:Transcript_47609/g.62936  ORF Transcript_47609/g.62936 Transcript_47609/m.62936 type:complete len:95 (+) Transcript_47609:790-1074(+)
MSNPMLSSSRTEPAHSPGRQSQFSHQTMPMMGNGNNNLGGVGQQNNLRQSQNFGYQGQQPMPSLLTHKMGPGSSGMQNKGADNQFQFNKTLHES